MTELRCRSFSEALLASGPASDREAELALYGQFVGSWTMEARIHRDDGTLFTGSGEIHFGWVLGGRAIQDVWDLPGVFYGTTLRVYDRALGAWHILWNDSLRLIFPRMIGRAVGDDIVQDGTDAEGKPIRWSFTKITRDSFLWLGERTPPGGGALELQVELAARRVAG